MTIELTVKEAMMLNLGLDDAIEGHQKLLRRRDKDAIFSPASRESMQEAITFYRKLQSQLPSAGIGFSDWFYLDKSDIQQEDFKQRDRKWFESGVCK
jgi:hypothetical protein